MFLMWQLSPKTPTQGNRIAPEITPKPKGAWKIEPSPTGRYGLANLRWGYVLPGLTLPEAQRAIELLGVASRWPDHGSAFVAIEACWGIIAGGAE